MAGRRSLLFVFLIIVLIFCSAVYAEDSNGKISVQVTRLDGSYSIMIYLLVGAVVVVALVFSTVLLLRARQSGAGQARVARNVPPRKAAPDIRLDTGTGQGFRDEGYYTQVFSRPRPDVRIIDEKDARQVTHVAESAGVDRYLKEDERIVLNVLRMKHNSCSQATLRVVTDFSKAKLSRILSELEVRGVIFKEQQGRKNMITLKT